MLRSKLPFSFWSHSFFFFFFHGESYLFSIPNMASDPGEKKTIADSLMSFHSRISFCPELQPIAFSLCKNPAELTFSQIQALNLHLALGHHHVAVHSQALGIQEQTFPQVTITPFFICLFFALAVSFPPLCAFSPPKRWGAAEVEF